MIMFVIELVEGRDAPLKIPKQFNTEKKTVGLLLRMLQLCFHTANYIVLDSGFCVLKEIIKTKIDFCGATGHDHGGWQVAAAVVTETTSTAEAAAVSGGEDTGSGGGGNIRIASLLTAAIIRQ